MGAVTLARGRTATESQAPLPALRRRSWGADALGGRGEAVQQQQALVRVQVRRVELGRQRRACLFRRRGRQGSQRLHALRRCTASGLARLATVLHLLWWPHEEQCAPKLPCRADNALSDLHHVIQAAPCKEPSSVEGSAM